MGKGEHRWFLLFSLRTCLLKEVHVCQWRCISATLGCFALCMQAQKNLWIYSFFASKQVGNGLVQMAQFFFFLHLCYKTNSQEIRRENYAGCCYQFKVHGFLSQILLCICLCLFASKPKYFYCFVLKTCYSAQHFLGHISIFNEYHIFIFFFWYLQHVFIIFHWQLNYHLRISVD